MTAVAAVAVLTAVAHFSEFPSGVTFVLATAALGGLAHVVGFATEQVGERFGPSIAGVLQASLGNLPELFVVVFALQKGNTLVAQTSIIGSIFANALLMLGLVIVVGSRVAEGGTMRFKARLPNDTATLMFVTTFIIVIVGIAHASHDPASHHERELSAIAAVLLLLVYLAWVVPYIRNPPAEAAHEESAPRVPFGLAVALLAAAATGAALVSDWFVEALTPTMEGLGVSQAFGGLVVVAIAGNAVENFGGIRLAARGQFDFAIAIVKNSVAQIGAFLYPLLVLISLLFAHQLTFALEPVYIGALLITALAMWQITGDGEAVAFEGWALIAIYGILATLTLYE
jgi:Ca2+:H+ antiporter